MVQTKQCISNKKIKLKDFRRINLFFILLLGGGNPREKLETTILYLTCRNNRTIY